MCLGALADGEGLLDSFDVMDEHGKKAGKLRVRHDAEKIERDMFGFTCPTFPFPGCCTGGCFLFSHAQLVLRWTFPGSNLLLFSSFSLVLCPQLGVKWKFPLASGRHCGPNALLGVELAEILSRFSPHKDGLVRYKVRRRGRNEEGKRGDLTCVPAREGGRLTQAFVVLFIRGM